MRGLFILFIKTPLPFEETASLYLMRCDLSSRRVGVVIGARRALLRPPILLRGKGGQCGAGAVPTNFSTNLSPFVAVQIMCLWESGL